MNTKFLILGMLLTGCGGAVDSTTGTWEDPVSTGIFTTGPVSVSSTVETVSSTAPSSSVGTSVETSTGVDSTTSSTETSTETVPNSDTTEEETVETDEGTSTDSVPSAPSSDVVVTDTTSSDDVVTTEEESTEVVDTTSTSDESSLETSEEGTSSGDEPTSEEEMVTSDETVDSTSAPEVTSAPEETSESPVVLLCTPNAACADDGNPCTNDVCSADGMTCTHPAKSNGTACGSSASSLCDSPDSCQAGVCSANHKPAGTSCDTDSNICTNNQCNASGMCETKAAPANTVCAAASCSDGLAIEAATCGGQTVCPNQETVECFGTCNDQGTGCEVAGVEEVYTSPNNLEQVTGNSSHVFFIEEGNVRRLSKTTRVVETLGYTKDQTTATMVLYPSDSVLLTAEVSADWTTYSLYCSDLDGSPKSLAATLMGSNLRITMDGSKAYAVISAIWSNGAYSSLYQIHCDGGVRAELIHTTESYTVIVGSPAVTPNSIYLALMDWARNDGHPHTYGQRVRMVSKATSMVLGTAEDVGFEEASNPNQNLEVAYSGGIVWFRNPDHLFSITPDVALDNSLLVEELQSTSAMSYAFNAWTSGYIYGMDFRRTSLTTGVTENWNQFPGVQYGLHLSNDKAYFHTDCWEVGPWCNDAIYSLEVE